MEFLRKLFVQTSNHLKGLSVSQRLAIGSCVVLIVVALLWLVNWAGSPVMVPLLDQPMTAEELAAIQQRLEAMAVKHKVVGDMVLVPADDQYRLYARLAQSQVLPRDTSIGFAKLIEKSSSPWLNMSEQDRRWTLAKSNELARILREFDGIADARVILDSTMKRTIGRASVVPTASVFIKPQKGVKLPRTHVLAIANAVSAAVAGLDATKVRVSDMTTGRSYEVPSVEDTLAFDNLEDRQAKETYFANKIKQLLANIPGLLVAVHAELDEEATQILDEKYGKSVPLKEKSETESTTRGRTAEEPGVNPNTSVAIGAGGNSESMEKTIDETTFDGKVDRTVTKTERPRHVIRKLFASVNVPRSYLAAIFKRSRDGKEPTDEELETFSKPELTKLKSLVLRTLALTGPADSVKEVEVAWVHDDATMQLGQVADAGAAEGMLTLVQAYGSKAGLAGLALISLLMMLMMVRKVSEGPVLPGEEPPSPRLIRMRGGRKKDAGEEVEMDIEGAIGEAEESDSLLVAKEVDERTAHAQKVIGQVADMIQEDPDVAVNVLKNWIGAETR